MRTLRLSILMIVGAVLGAFIGSLINISLAGDRPDRDVTVAVRREIVATLTGALCALPFETMLRLSERSSNISWRFSTRELLAAMVIAALALGSIVILWRS